MVGATRPRPKDGGLRVKFDEALIISGLIVLEKQPATYPTMPETLKESLQSCSFRAKTQELVD